MKKNLKHLVTIIILAVFISCTSWTVPEILIGNWTQNTEVTFRTKKDGKYHFQKFPEKMEISINSDGKVSGKIGSANLVNCRIEKNRGQLGKSLNLKTDYRIIGEMKGKINNSDPNEIRKISIPFNLEEGKLKGSCFEGGGFDIFPFSDLDMTKDTL